MSERKTRPKRLLGALVTPTSWNWSRPPRPSNG